MCLRKERKHTQKKPKKTVGYQHFLLFPWPHNGFKSFLRRKPPNNGNDLINEVLQKINSSEKKIFLLPEICQNVFAFTKIDKIELLLSYY